MARNRCGWYKLTIHIFYAIKVSQYIDLCYNLKYMFVQLGGTIMRIKDGFVLREVAGQAMVIATGEASKDFYGMIKLNETGKEIWQALQDGKIAEEIVVLLKDKYDVKSGQAENDVAAFIKQMEEMGFLVDE